MFLSALGFMATLATCAGQEAAGRDNPRPNILFIITDQQHANMLSCAGNEYLKTPAMDALAASGIRFEQAYTTNPVCLPARFSFMTGRMPSAARILRNKAPRVPEDFALRSMGSLFQRAGYETVYGGKVHLPRGLSPGDMGFRPLTGDSRGKLVESCVEFLQEPPSKPFLLVASFINPHDICYMAINDYRRSQGQEPHGNVDSETMEGLIREPLLHLDRFVQTRCPPLPANFAVPHLEPECITEKYLKVHPFRQFAREKWTPAMWRLHRWAYCRLTEMVDARIRSLLAALRAAGLEKNTLVVLTSDHGDLDGAHRLEHKLVLYEEAVRIPLILSFRGVIPAGIVDKMHLVSNGLDLLPTLCEYAGIEAPQDLPGRSLKPLAEGKPVASWRDFLAVESRNGRMVRTERFKYCIYDSGNHREQLIDLEEDPGEMVNLAPDEEHQQTLNKHRELLKTWMAEVKDPFAESYLPQEESTPAAPD